MDQFMTSSGPTVLSLTAAGLYGLVVLACVAAMITAASTRQSPIHQRSWAMLAMLFALLVVARMLDLEHAIEDRLRAAMRAADSYGNRRSVQALIALAFAAIAAIIGGGWLYRTARHARGRRAIAVALAQGAGMVMITLIGLRLVSFHTLDALLYGPFKLNWFLDLGAGLTVGGAALFYITALRQRRRREPRGDPQ